MEFLDLTTAAPWVKAVWIAAAFAVGYALYRAGAWLLARRGRATDRFAIGFLFFYALAVSAAVFHLQQRTERKQLLLWAERIARPRDLKSERLFAERVADLADDPTARALTAVLNEAVAPAQTDSDNGPTAGRPESPMTEEAAADSLTAYLKRQYFTDHWRGYHFYLTVCRANESLQIDSADIVPCLDFFDEKTDRIGEATGCEGLYAMNYGVEYYSYLYRCVLTPSTPTTATTTASDPTVANPKTTAPTKPADARSAVYLFAEWGRSKLSRRREEMPDTYSYAYYVDGALWSRRGHFLYDFDISGKVSATSGEDPIFIRENGYLHCALKMSPAQLLVLTTPALKPASLLHYFSFFLSIFFAAGLLLESLRHRTLFKARTYAQRLQYTVFGLVACAFAVLGIVSFFFIREIDRDEQTDRLKEKSLSALTALESRFMDFAPHEFPAAAIDRFPGFLTELAHVLSADLYLFDREGHFLLSNRHSAEQPQALCRRPFFHELQARNSPLQIRAEHRPHADSTAQ
ncbi:MAG: hypothetical protein K2O01_07095, partial [Bacteroidales bacterium]|nr:hypothetical protein [Bacteroidales bacterium]